MPTEQSQFSKLPKKQLVFISEKLIDEEFPIGNPYDYDFHKSYKTLESVSRYFSITSTYEDVEFFSKFLEVNEDVIAELFANNRKNIENRELIEQLIIPVAKTYTLDYAVGGTCNYTEYLTQEFDCYDIEWVRDSADQQRNDGNWNTWEGKQRSPTEYENYEENDFQYDDVYEVEDDKIKKESILGKLVIENTSEVINSLDKKTLLKLRRVIDSKLRLL